MIEGVRKAGDEARLEIGRHIAVERRDDVLADKVEQPARADDREVGVGAGGDVGRQLLLQIVPGHDFDLDLGAGIGGLEGLGGLLEIGAGALGIFGDGHAHRARRGDRAHREQAGAREQQAIWRTSSSRRFPCRLVERLGARPRAACGARRRQRREHETNFAQGQNNSRAWHYLRAIFVAAPARERGCFSCIFGAFLEPIGASRLRIWRRRPVSSSADGRRALITGAGGGIGRALVATFRAAGATVIAADRDRPRWTASICEHRLAFDLTDARGDARRGRRSRRRTRWRPTFSSATPASRAPKRWRQVDADDLGARTRRSI